MPDADTEIGDAGLYVALVSWIERPVRYPGEPCGDCPPEPTWLRDMGTTQREIWITWQTRRAATRHAAHQAAPPLPGPSRADHARASRRDWLTRNLGRAPARGWPRG